jgi:fucose 4-O-acetylase-like acetyltransferase
MTLGGPSSISVAPAAPDAAVATPAAAKRRVAYLDNARFWVMILVVIGHPLLYLIEMPAARTLYYWIYLFHMPLFALISGYISRNFVGTRKQLRRTVSTLVVPYFLIETTYQLLNRHLAEQNGNPINTPMMLLSPKWVAWFLAALLVWRLTTPLWRALRHPIIVSILISLLVPLTEVPNVFAMHKTLGMLPFYVIGMHFTMSRFHRLSDTRVRIGSVFVLVAAGVISWFGSPHWSLQWQKWRLSYDELHASPLLGIATRAALLAAGVLLSVAILSLVPWQRSWTSPMGERTLYCYLLHGFVVIGLAKGLRVFDLMLPWGGWAIATTLTGAVLLAIVLMTPPVAAVFRPLFEPKLKWLFKKRAVPLRGQHVGAGMPVLNDITHPHDEDPKHAGQRATAS